MKPELIFLISQPRAGSTMLQRMLGAHPKVHTISEPWLMLHPLYALKRNALTAEYNSRLAREALDTVFDALPEGEDGYIQGLRTMYGYLYARLLEGSGKSVFLDKTPRYYLIIPELARVFPEAKFIILLRNPLAVLVSILNSWVKEDWRRLRNFQTDLFRAPGLLADGLPNLGDRAAKVQYEELVHDPEDHIRNLSRFLEIPFDPATIDYGDGSSPDWRFGDQKSVHQLRQPDPRKATQWMDSLDDPQVWRCARDYLEFLRPELLTRLGYRYEELCEQMGRHEPSPLDRAATWPLTHLCQFPDRKDGFVGAITHSLAHRGATGTASAALRRLRQALASVAGDCM